MTYDNYIYTSVQKGGVLKFSRFVEHTSINEQLIRQGIFNKKNLTVVWLDLANAYGTIRHILKEQSLRSTIYQSILEKSFVAISMGSISGLQLIKLQLSGRNCKREY